VFSDGSKLVADAEHQWLTVTAGSFVEPIENRGRIVTTEQIASSMGDCHLVRNARPLVGGAQINAPSSIVDGIGQRKISEVRRIGSVPVKCVEVDNLDHMYLAGRSMVPTHNSTLGLDICRSASIRHNMASVIFSLEMTRNEITMRLLSAEAKIPLVHMRNGLMNDEDWAKLARRMGEVSGAPFFIDDSPNMTMMEIRAKARRLKQRHDLRLIVIDYLQLMSSGKKVESRQVEMSEFSRQIKLLAKELDIPIVALSQLNRGSEQRSDKKPLMSDLRECLTGDTLVTRADAGQQVPIRDLVGQRDVPVWTVDERLRIRRGVMSDVWCTGVKPVHRLTLASGRQVAATGNHPLRTVDGWQPVDALRTGDAVAVARAEVATSGVRWDRIVGIEAIGEAEVYDAHVPGTHSFLANDVVSHNSGAIEQDADMVILLHREDLYERESTRPDEADLIVAKHRNGPTRDVTVTFQGRYSRFVDMAHG